MPIRNDQISPSLFFLTAFIAFCTLVACLVSAFGDVPRMRYFQLFDFFLVLLLVLLLPLCIALLTSLLHLPQFRAGAVVCSAILAITATAFTFEFFEISLWRRHSEAIWYSIMILLALGLPAGASLMFRDKPWARLASRTLLWAALVGGSLLILLLWLEELQRPARVLSTFMVEVKGAIVWAYSGVFLVALLLINFRRDPRTHFRWIGIATAALSWLLYLVSLRVGTHANRWLLAADAVFVFTFTLAFIQLFLIPKAAGLTRIFQFAAIRFTALFAVIFAFLLFVSGYQGSDILDLQPFSFVIRANVIAAFLALGSALAFLIALAMRRAVTLPTSPENISTLQLICPGCGTSQTLSLDDPSCHHCLLQFSLKFFEPHCPQCDHLLINLTSNRCPSAATPCTAPPPSPPISPPRMRHPITHAPHRITEPPRPPAAPAES